MKTHKLPLVAQMQLDAGACGITCQKLGEAEVMADRLRRHPDHLSADRHREARAARGARRAGPHLRGRRLGDGRAGALGRARRARNLDRLPGRVRHRLRPHRGPDPADAAELAAAVDSLPGLELAGLMTIPRRRAAAVARLGAHADRGARTGGRPGQRRWNARAYRVHESGVFTELRVGTYVYADRRCVLLGLTPLEDCALRVVATVVSRPTPERAIIDGGSKTFTSDPLPGLAGEGGHGLVVEYPEARVVRLSEEHGQLDLSACPSRPQVGEVVSVIPNHACGAVNLHDEVALHRSGSDLTVVPIPARGRIVNGCGACGRTARAPSAGTPSTRRSAEPARLARGLRTLGVGVPAAAEVALRRDRATCSLIAWRRPSQNGHV